MATVAGGDEFYKTVSMYINFPFCFMKQFTGLLLKQFTNDADVSFIIDIDLQFSPKKKKSK